MSAPADEAPSRLQVEKAKDIDESEPVIAKDGKDKGKGEEKKPKAQFSNYYRIFAYARTTDWLLMGVCVATSIGAGVTMPLMNVVFGRLVGDFTNYFVPNSGVTRAEFDAAVRRNALYIVYLFIGKFFLSYCSMLAVRISGLRISANLRLHYLKALLAQPVESLDQVSPGKVSSRITTSSNTIQLAISQQLALLLQALAFTIGLYVVAFIYDWLLTLVASAGIPLIFISYGGTIPFFIKIHKRTEETQELASSFAFEIFTSVRIVVAFGAEDRLADQHDELLNKAEKNEKKCGPLSGVMVAPAFFALYATFALAFWFGLHQFAKGNIDGIGTITVVLFSVLVAVMGLGRLTNPIISIAKAATAATELFTTIDAYVPDQTGLKAPDVSPHKDITFANVSFRYPSRKDVQVLDDLSVTFEAGKVTAIVGPSGSGKSTIVGLLQRWYALSEPIVKVEQDKKGKEAAQSDSDSEKSPTTVLGGIIRVGEHDLSKIDAKWWRSQIGLVQQEPFLFNDTIYTNVAYGLSGTEWQNASREEKMAMVKEACKEAYAHEFISRLPQGYDTYVGESGIKMSGGQRQRIAIARSIIKKPPILILDEATSAIDVRTERIVQKALDRVSQNRTTIVIAHRLSTIQRADKIIVLRHGSLIEQGTHQELVANEDGVYHGLVHAQALTMGQAGFDDGEGAENTPLNLFKEHLEAHEAAVSSTNDEEKGVIDLEKPETYQERGVLSSFGKLYYEQRRHWILYLFTVLGAMAAGAVYPLQAWIFAKLLEVFTFTGSELTSRGNFWSLMYFIQSLVVFVGYFMIGWAAFQSALVVSTAYRKEYFRNMIRKRIPFFDAEGNSPGTLTSRLSTDTTQIQQVMGTEMSFAYVAVFNLIGSVIISFVFGWKLTLVGLFAILPAILAAGFYRVRLEMEFEKLNSAIFANSSQFATEAVSAFRTVTSLILEDTITQRYIDLLDGQVHKAFRKAAYSTIIFALSDSVELACMALCFWYGGRLLGSYEYDLVQYFVIYTAVVQGAQAAGIWFSFAPNMAEATSAANRILSLRQSKADNAAGTEALKAKEGFGIEFKDVQFSYKSREVPVLTGLSLKVKPGQFVGIVGASGCGKSTVISLIERFYDTDSGTISVGDQNIRDVNVKDYRGALALVAQESTLYEGTIWENVALSVEKDAATDEAIQKACVDAQIHDFIISLPQGYSTHLGPKGVSLSGGQRQRLALARALLRKPKLLLLDEATSSLDSTSELLVQEAIERAAGEGSRTVIAVAHRLATIQKADVIFVLGSGKVLEQGTHHDLLRRRGMYYQMCQAQSLDR